MILQSKRKTIAKTGKRVGAKTGEWYRKWNVYQISLVIKFLTMFMIQYTRVLMFCIYLSISDKAFGQSIFCDKLGELCTSPLKWNDSRSSWLSSVFFEKFNLSSKSWLRCIAFVDVFIVSAVLKVYKNCQLTSTMLHSNHRIEW